MPFAIGQTFGIGEAGCCQCAQFTETEYFRRIPCPFIRSVIESIDEICARVQGEMEEWLAAA